MSRVKKNINFSTIIKDGPKAVSVKGDEVIRLVSSKKETMAIVTEEFLLQLLSIKAKVMQDLGLEKEILVDIETQSKIFNKELEEIVRLAKEDESLI